MGWIYEIIHRGYEVLMDIIYSLYLNGSDGKMIKKAVQQIALLIFPDPMAIS